METIYARIHPQEFNYVRETYHYSQAEYGPAFLEHIKHSIPGCTLLAVGVTDGLVHRAWFLESFIPGHDLNPFDVFPNREPLPKHFLVFGDSVRPDAKSKLFLPAHNEARYCVPLEKRPDRWLGRWEQAVAPLVVIRASLLRRAVLTVRHTIREAYRWVASFWR